MVMVIIQIRIMMLMMTMKMMLTMMMMLGCFCCGWPRQMHGVSHWGGATKLFARTRVEYDDDDDGDDDNHDDNDDNGLPAYDNDDFCNNNNDDNDDNDNHYDNFTLGRGSRAFRCKQNWATMTMMHGDDDHMILSIMMM